MGKVLRKTCFAAFAVLMVLTLFLLCAQVRADFAEAKNVPTVIGGVNCMVDYHADGTALICKVSDPAEPTELTIPATLSYGGYEYTVTGLSWGSYVSSSDEAPNIMALTLPNTLTELNSVPFSVFPRRMRELLRRPQRRAVHQGREICVQ